MTSTKTTNFDRIVNTISDHFNIKDIDAIFNINEEIHKASLEISYDNIIEKINCADEVDIVNIINYINDTEYPLDLTVQSLVYMYLY